MKSNIAMYARVSSEKQAQDGTIKSQLEAVKEFAKENNLSIDSDLMFIDNGVSGEVLARPGLDAMRDKAANGEIDKVIILNPDRLARKFAYQLMIVEEFQKLGVEIIFVNRSISQSPEDQLLLQIQGVIAEYEKEKIMDRHRRGKLHKAKAGKVSVLSGAPYGYVYITASNGEDARYEIHPPEAEVVKSIFEMLVEKHLTIGAIAKYLTRENIPTKNRVGHWERAVVWGMLKNPAYKGQAAYRKTRVVQRNKPTKLARDRGFYPKHVNSSTRDRPRQEWITIAVPAIIDEATFEKAQEKLQENKKFSSRNNKKNQYLLSGLLRCKECGYSLYGNPASNSKNNRCYYRCLGQDGYRWPKGRVCSSHPVRIEAMDELVWQQTLKLIEQPKLILSEYTSRLDKKQRQQSQFTQLMTKKSREIKQQELEKERLLDLYQRGQVSLSEIEHRLKSIRTKIKKLQDESLLLEKEAQEQSNQLQLIEQFQDFTRRMTSNLSNLSFQEKQKIVRLLVQEVVVNTKEEEILVRHILPLQPQPETFSLCKGSSIPACCHGRGASLSHWIPSRLGYSIPQTPVRPHSSPHTKVWGLSAAFL